MIRGTCFLKVSGCSSHAIGWSKCRPGTIIYGILGKQVLSGYQQIYARWVSVSSVGSLLESFTHSPHSSARTGPASPSQLQGVFSQSHSTALPAQNQPPLLPFFGSLVLLFRVLVKPLGELTNREGLVICLRSMDEWLTCLTLIDWPTCPK